LAIGITFTSGAQRDTEGIVVVELRIERNKLLVDWSIDLHCTENVKNPASPPDS
jgi:hypothetical protein